MIGVFTVFRLIGRRAARLHVAQPDRRRLRSSVAIDLRFDRSIAVSPVSSRDGLLDDDVPIKLARGVYGDRLIDRDPKSSAIRCDRSDAAQLHAVSVQGDSRCNE